MKSIYVVTVNYSIQLEGEEIDYITEQEQFESYDEAVNSLSRHVAGSIEGFYTDGAVCVCAGADLDEELQEEEEEEVFY